MLILVANASKHGATRGSPAQYGRLATAGHEALTLTVAYVVAVEAST